MGSGVSLGRRRARKQPRLEGHEGSVNAVSLTSDGGLVVTGSDDCTARVWDAETRELVAEMKGHSQYVNCLTITANDEFVVTGKYLSRTDFCIKLPSLTARCQMCSVVVVCRVCRQDPSQMGYIFRSLQNSLRRPRGSHPLRFGSPTFTLLLLLRQNCTSLEHQNRRVLAGVLWPLASRVSSHLCQPLGSRQKNRAAKISCQNGTKALHCITVEVR